MGMTSGQARSNQARSNQARFAWWCRLVRFGAMVVIAGLAAIVAIAAIALLRGQTGGVAETGTRWLLVAVSFSPAVGYAWALWAIQRALGELGTGGRFPPAMARAVRHVGYGVIAGALLSVFVVTNVTRMLLHGRGGFMYFDMSGIVLAVVGAALILLARLFDRAQSLQSELDEIV